MKNSLAGDRSARAGAAVILDPARTREEAYQFDPQHHLDLLLADIGLSSRAFGGETTFLGMEPSGPSVFRMGAAAGIASAAYTAAVASLWAERTGESQNVLTHLNEAPRKVSPLQHQWERLNGYPIHATADPQHPFAQVFQTRDRRWVLPGGVYPRLRSSILRILQCCDHPSDIARAVANWDALELESEAARVGADVTMVRTLREFLREPQYQDHLDQLPLIEIRKTAESEPIPFRRAPSGPLSEVRVLGFAKGTAAVVGRSLAQYGADVLNIWRPQDFEHDSLYLSSNLGVRSALIDPEAAEGRRAVSDLLAGADVIYTNRRSSLLQRAGLSAEQVAARKAGTVHVQISLHGSDGPWASRVGSASSAAAAAGILAYEGSESSPVPPVSTFVVDRIAGWMAAAGATAALIRRSKEGGSYRVHVSLTRVCLWLYSLGLLGRKRPDTDCDDESQTHIPHTFTISTHLGLYTGVSDPALLSRTREAFLTQLAPRGGSRPVWLPFESEMLWI